MIACPTHSLVSRIPRNLTAFEHRPSISAYKYVCFSLFPPHPTFNQIFLLRFVTRQSSSLQILRIFAPLHTVMHSKHNIRHLCTATVHLGLLRSCSALQPLWSQWLTSTGLLLVIYHPADCLRSAVHLTFFMSRSHHTESVSQQSRTRIHLQ